MATPYAGNPDNYPEEIIVPDDGDLRSASVTAAALEGLADRTVALVPRLATYTAGTTAWVKPDNCLFVQFLIVGGGGAAGGHTGGTTLRGAGGGGGSGERWEGILPAALVPDTLNATVGVGGTGVDGDDGGVGGGSIVANGNFLILAQGGKGGKVNNVGTGGLGGEPGGYIASPSAGDRAHSFVGAWGGTGSDYDAGGSDDGQSGGYGYTASGGAGGTSGDAEGKAGRGYGAGGGGSCVQSGTNGKGGGGGGGYGTAVLASNGLSDTGTPHLGGGGAPGYIAIISWCGIEAA